LRLSSSPVVAENSKDPPDSIFPGPGQELSVLGRTPGIPLKGRSQMKEHLKKSRIRKSPFQEKLIVAIISFDPVGGLGTKMVDPGRTYSFVIPHTAMP
jgi:hypothetical protein